MSGKRYPEEFKIEAVKQVTDRGYKASGENMGESGNEQLKTTI
jgi:transposase-like protein